MPNQLFYLNSLDGSISSIIFYGIISVLFFFFFFFLCTRHFQWRGGGGGGHIVSPLCLLICVLDSYIIYRYIIVKYGQVRFRVKSANYYESYGPFSTSFFAKCLRVGEDGPGRGHLCHTDTFLVNTKNRLTH